MIEQQSSKMIADALRTIKTAPKDSQEYKSAVDVLNQPYAQAVLSQFKETGSLTEMQNDTATEKSTGWWLTTFLPIFLGCVIGFLALAFLVIRLAAKGVEKRFKGRVLNCTCTKCNTTRDELYENIMQGGSGLWTRQKSIKKGITAAGAGVSTSHYTMYQKKFYCPTCGKRTWHEINNINELMYENTPILKKTHDAMFSEELQKEKEKV